MKQCDVAIIDYGLGNLFSIKQACTHVGLSVTITSDPTVVESSRAVILPGVGAFGDAMNELGRLGLVDSIHGLVERGTPLMGLCLGLQLLFDGSEEFGAHQGLGIIPGQVRYLPVQKCGERTLKVPQVAWNEILAPEGKTPDSWNGTLLQSTVPGTPMYFVHSCYVIPNNPDVVLTETVYGDVRFCSSCKKGNVTAFQFHPERSGPRGLNVYRELRNTISQQQENE